MRDRISKNKQLRPNEYGGNWLSNINVTASQPLKTCAIEKFKEYDFKGAMADFKQVLFSEPSDVPTLFNLACCYAMEEDAAQALVYLDQAIALGFKDFDRIRSHDRLAYLRIQPEYDAFVANGFRIPIAPKVPEIPIVTEAPTMTLQAQLKQLHDDYEAGKIKNEEFMLATKKLLE